MCEPEKIGYYEEGEEYDSNGSIVYHRGYIYNCEECDEENCKYWKEYN